MMDGMMGSGRGAMMNGMMGRAGTALTAAQQKQADAIESQSRAELKSKAKAVQDKIAAIDKAYSNDSTTVSQLRAQRQELYNLRQDYWQVRNTVNKKISAALGITYGGGWGPRYCYFNSGNMGGPGNNGMMMGPGRHCRW
jgi:Spy/CpxP family protein refolding chaperone